MPGLSDQIIYFRTNQNPVPAHTHTDSLKAVTYNPEQNAFMVSNIPVPKPEASDVLVRVDACGLNPVDAKIALWKPRVHAMDESWVCGLDVSGYIVETGSEVVGWEIGDRVLYHGNMYRRHGGFAEYALHEHKTLLRHPALPAASAAAIPCAGWTAWRALNDVLHASERDSILIAGGSGGVGGFAIQVARYFGVSPIIVTSSVKNRDYVLSLGATHFIDYRNESIVERVFAITDEQGVTLGLDTVGEENDVFVANALAPAGRMVELVRPLRRDSYKDPVGRELEFHQLSLGAGHRSGPRGQEILVAAGEACTALVEEGRIHVGAMRVIPLEEVALALVEILQQRTVGKIVMEAGGNS